jgi:hypothetical protein
MNSAARHLLPFVGRPDILEQVIGRLQRPDDVRNNPDEFIMPGFYGLAGTGKSRLLLEITKRARQLTPYVVGLDFDARSGSVPPSTPLNLSQQLIDALEQADRSARPRWRRLMWRWSNPFKACRLIIHQLNLPSLGAIPAGLSQAFQQALPGLYAKAQTKVLFGNFGQARRLPLILIIFDTVELAPRPLHQWLPDILSLPGGYNKLRFHLVFVFAGRSREDLILETPLPPLPASEARSFVREYASYLLKKPRQRDRPETLQLLLTSEPAQNTLASQGQGIPLLIQLLVDAASIESGIDFLSRENLPSQHDARVGFATENYVRRLREQASSQQDDQLWRGYYLLLCAAVPVRIPNARFLRALLSDLPRTQFNQLTNYDERFEELLHEAFVEQAKDGALIVHSLIREGIEAYLKDNEPELLTAAHFRSADWFQHANDEANYFYHDLRVSLASAFGNLKARIEEGLQQKSWSGVQLLIETTTGLSLSPLYAAWITSACSKLND